MLNKGVMFSLGIVLVFVMISIFFVPNFTSANGESSIYENQVISRTATSNTIRTPQGFQTTYYSGEKNYLNEENTYVPYEIDIINSNINFMDTEYSAYNNKNKYNVYFKDQSSSIVNEPVRYYKDGYTITFTPNSLLFLGQTNLHKKQSFVNVSENKATYVGQFGDGIDLSYTYLNNKLQKELVINSLQELKDAIKSAPDDSDILQLKFTVKAYDSTNESQLQNLKIGDTRIDFSQDLNDISTSENIEFLDKDNNTVYYFPQPYITDSAGNKTMLNFIYDVNRFNNLVVKIQVPYTLLKNAVYPIFIDPSITYLFNSTYENISMFAIETPNNDGCSAYPPTDGPIPATCSTWVDFTADGGLDSFDGTSATSGPGASYPDRYPSTLFYANITNLNINDITLINWSYTRGNSGQTGFNHYFWNSTNWVLQGIFGGAFYNASNWTSNKYFWNDSIYNNTYLLVESSDKNNALYADFVQLSITYDDLIINQPTSNQEILNNLSTVLNTSQSGYNHTIWYTWNGIKNYSLCTNSNECQGIITFPRTGYYNLTVYGNKSDGTQTSKSVNNLFVGNETIYNYNIEQNIKAYECGRTSSSFPIYPINSSWCTSSFVDWTSDATLNALDSNFASMGSGVSTSYIWYLIIQNIYLNQTYTRINVTLNEKMNQNEAHNQSLYVYNKTSGGYYNPSVFSCGGFCGGDIFNLSWINTSSILDYIDSSGNMTLSQWGSMSTGGSAASIDFFNMSLYSYSNNIIPSVTNNLSNNSNFSNSNVNFTFNISDDNDYLTNISLYLDGVLNTTSYINYSINNSINTTLNFTKSLAEGTHTWFIQVYDSDNNLTNSSTFQVRIDTTPPSVSINNPTDYQSFTYQTGIQFNYTASDSGIGLDDCWYTNNSGVNNYSLANCQTNFTIDEVGDGNYEVTVYSNDSLNNIGFDTIHYTISLTAPATTINYPTNDKWFSSGTGIQFNVTSTDTNGLANCSLYENWTSTWVLNETNITTITSGVTYNFTNNIIEGFHKFNFLCFDTTGASSWATSNFTFGVDLTKPLINLTYPNNITYTTIPIQLNFTKSDTNLFNCWYSTDKGITNSSPNNCDNFSVTAVQGQNNYTIYINDSANNQNSSSISFFVDSINPALSLSTSFSNGSYINYNESIIINVSVTDANLDKCWYSDTGLVNTTFTCGNNLSLDLNESLHQIIVYSNDTLNNLNSSNISFTPDVTYPKINGIVESTTPSNQVFNFVYTLNESNKDSCNYSFDGGLTNNTILLCVTSVVGAIIPTLGTDYNMTIYTVDLAGNRNLTYKTINIPVTLSVTPGGGGGSSEQRVPVIAINQINSSKVYSDLDKAIFYTQINSYCSNKVRNEPLAIADYSKSCTLVQSDLNTLLPSLKVNTNMNDLVLFYKNYKESRFFQFYATQTQVNTYDLFTSVLGLTTLLTLSPSSLDKPVIINVGGESYTLTYNIASNKPLKSCDILEGDKNLVSCLVQNSTVTVKYNLTNTKFFNEIFKAVISVQTDAPSNQLESKKLPVVFRVYNLGWNVLGTPLIFFVLIVLLGISALFIIGYKIIPKTKRLKIKESLELGS